MMSVVECGSLLGVTAIGVRVEASPVRGLPGFDIVGLPEAGIRESRVRVLAALRNSGFSLPEQRFVVNLAPADLRKSGSSFDLAIAIALLAQCGLCAPNRLPEMLIVGELSLDGQIRGVRGLLSQLQSARARGLREALIPEADAGWGALCEGMRMHCAAHLTDAVAFLSGELTLSEPSRAARAEDATAHPDLYEVRGQEAAKRALEVAAAGGHDVLMIGPPGSGKTMLARRVPGILPPPSAEERLEIATIASASGLPAEPLQLGARPFRAPHHGVSDVALVGGGDPIRPGEVTLAHRGVLFLDELPELRRSALEALRPTMESGQAVIARTRDRAVMPAKPLIVAAMNPCPCGYQGHAKRICRCTPDQVRRYRGRVSGPLLDRFDLHVALPALSVRELERAANGESSAAVRARVVRARAFACERERMEKRARGGEETRGAPLLRLARELTPSALRFLHQSVTALALSLRAYAKVLKVSRTIADLEASREVELPHVAEAIQYRLFDREESRPRPGAASQPVARAGATSDPGASVRRAARTDENRENYEPHEGDRHVDQGEVESRRSGHR